MQQSSFIQAKQENCKKVSERISDLSKYLIIFMNVIESEAC